MYALPKHTLSTHGADGDVDVRCLHPGCPHSVVAKQVEKGEVLCRDHRWLSNLNYKHADEDEEKDIVKESFCEYYSGTVPKSLYTQKGGVSLLSPHSVNPQPHIKHHYPYVPHFLSS